MHRIFGLVGLGAILAALAFGCKKRSETPAANVHGTNPVTPGTASAPSVAAPEPRRLLKVKWPPAARYVYRMEMEQHSTNSFGQAAERNREDLAQGVTYALTVLPPSSSGDQELEVEFLANDLEIKLGGQVAVQFDSTVPATNQTRQAPAPLRRVVGSKIRLQVGPDGNVQKVIGRGDWIRQVVGDSTGPAAQMLYQQFNDGFMQQLADFGRALPGKPVAVGESWPFHNDLPAGALGTISLDSTITFRRHEHQDDRELAVLESKGTARQPGAGCVHQRRGREGHGQAGGVREGQLAKLASETGRHSKPR
jgi:hypothetical protein